MVPVSLLALFGLWHERPRRGPALLLLLLLGYFFAMHLVVFGGPRTRLAADASLIAFAASGIWTLRGWLTKAGAAPSRLRAD